jgi:hypothetical protein
MQMAWFMVKSITRHLNKVKKNFYTHMSKPILNEGYNNKDTIFFDSGYKDNIFSNKKKYIDLGFC